MRDAVASARGINGFGLSVALYVFAFCDCTVWRLDLSAALIISVFSRSWYGLYALHLLDPSLIVHSKFLAADAGAKIILCCLAVTGVCTACCTVF